MANFSQLQTDVADLVAKSNLSGSMLLLTRLAQDTLSRAYSPRFLRQNAQITMQADTFILPTNLHRILAVRVWSPSGVSTIVSELSESVARVYANTMSQSEPYFWRELGGLCHLTFTPPVDYHLELDYVINDTYPVNATDTNLWLLNAYDLLLLETCSQAMMYINDVNRMSVYHTRAMEGLKHYQHNDVANEVSGYTALLKGGHDA